MGEKSPACPNQVGGFLLMKQKLQKGDKVPFTQVANAVLNDKALSFKAKGLFAYLYSKDDRYDFSSRRIVKDSTDGLDSVLAGLKELEFAGYLERTKLKTGRVVYTIRYAKTAEPQQGKIPEREIPLLGKSQQGKTRTITNIDKETNIDKKQTFFSKKKEVVEILLDAYSSRWEEHKDNRDDLLDNLRFSLKLGNKLISRAPTLVSDYLSFRDEGYWKTKEDFLATMRNLTKEIEDAGVGNISTSAWEDALEKTAHMDMATIRTVIKSV